VLEHNTDLNMHCKALTIISRWQNAQLEAAFEKWVEAASAQRTTFSRRALALAAQKAHMTQHAPRTLAVPAPGSVAATCRGKNAEDLKIRAGPEPGLLGSSGVKGAGRMTNVKRWQEAEASLDRRRQEEEDRRRKARDAKILLAQEQQRGTDRKRWLYEAAQAQELELWPAEPLDPVNPSHSHAHHSSISPSGVIPGLYGCPPERDGSHGTGTQSQRKHGKGRQANGAEVGRRRNVSMSTMTGESGKMQAPIRAPLHRTHGEEMRTRQEAHEQLRIYVLQVATFFRV